MAKGQYGCDVLSHARPVSRGPGRQVGNAESVFVPGEALSPVIANADGDACTPPHRGVLVVGSLHDSGWLSAGADAFENPNTTAPVRSLAPLEDYAVCGGEIASGIADALLDMHPCINDGTDKI